ncbi:phospholipase D-like domain-containing protein [Achromobacter sp. JD417]|uniref:hypothetical protein n=1 Tax=Achromobacter sp. JD417 TaxID=2893881 RepID=UPI0035A6EF60
MLIHSEGKFQDFLQLHEVGSQQCSEILAAIPYAMEGVSSQEIYETATLSDINITTFCRLDWSIPFDTRLIQKYSSQSVRFLFIAEYLHAKVIWWKGWGAYVGSCNLTDRACFENYEAGYFIEQDAIERSCFDKDLTIFFDGLRDVAIEPTDEIFDLLRKQTDRLANFRSLRRYLSHDFSIELRSIINGSDFSM